MKPTVKDIAVAANVSPATVSNALNNRKGVSDSVKQLVFKAAKELGYAKESSVERNAVRFVIYKRHGFVVSDTPFFSSLIEGIEKQCRTLGYELLISHVNRNDKDFKATVDSINNDRSSGILILATEMTDEDLGLFYHFGTPVVLLDSYFRSNILDSVLINNTDAAFKATKFLIENGHEKIGYLQSSYRINNFDYRRQGYQEAMNCHGLEIDGRYQVSLEPTLEGAYRNMKALLAKGDLPLPTAYFADNDIIAYGAMKALSEKGINIPGDVSLVGFDDMPFCEMMNPRLTTIKVFKQEMGSIAVKRLVEKINGRDCIIQKIEVGTEMIIRDSHKSNR